MLSLNPNVLKDLPKGPISPWAESSKGGANDSMSMPWNCLSRMGEKFLGPLNICGRYGQYLKSVQAENHVQKIWLVVRKMLLLVAIALCLIPALIGSLFKRVSNPPLTKDGNFASWDLATSPAWRSVACNLLGDFNKPESQIGADLIKIVTKLPELPTCSSIFVRKDGHKDYFTHKISFQFREYGVKRPNGDDIHRNMMNSFLPERASPITLAQAKVLGNLLLGIKTGSTEDYKAIREHLSSSTEIVLQIDLNWEKCGVETWEKHGMQITIFH